jgi:hypothetical protein
MTTAIALFALLTLAACVFVGRWRHLMKLDRLSLGEMLLRQGAELPELSQLAGRELGRAVRRCMSCSSAQRCGAWLDKGEREGYEAFCPNAGFIEDLKKIRL